MSVCVECVVLEEGEGVVHYSNLFMNPWKLKMNFGNAWLMGVRDPTPI